MVKVTVDRQSPSALLLSMPRPLYLSHKLGTMSYWFLLEMAGELKSCTACLHETSRRDEKVRDPRRDAENFWSETVTRPETHRSETETRPRRSAFCPRRDRGETLVRLETVSRPRRRDRDHIPAHNHNTNVTLWASDPLD